MRILSWNINGIRTIPQYHPWNSFKTFQGVLDHLEADVICFQEMKTSRSALDKNTAVPLPGYDSFFSFPCTKKGGYSGVAVYTSTETAIPLKAEEGLTGRLQPTKPPLTSEERITPFDPIEISDLVLPEDRDHDPTVAELGDYSFDVVSLDMEGRALMIDFGLFVLINLYCPNETSETRLPFKMAFHRLMERRVRQLVKEQGREVVVIGDINICAAPIDHCDGHLESTSRAFWVHPARRWLKEWLADEESGRPGMVDVLRLFHKDRKGMYTCWNTKISARETNYGTRIDYVLVTPGLLPWIKHGDIQPSVKGSDHCPVYVDLHDEIILDNGRKKILKDEMKMVGTERREPPRLAAKNWDEYSGKQTLLSTFFAKGGGKSADAKPSRRSERSTPSLPPSHSSQPTLSQQSAICIDADEEESTPPPSSLPPSQCDSQPPSQPSPPYTSKRKLSDTDTISPISTAITTFSSETISTSPPSSPQTPKAKKPKIERSSPQSEKSTSKAPKAGQTKLSTFFVKPKPSKPSKLASSSSSPTNSSEATSPSQPTAAPLMAGQPSDPEDLADALATRANSSAAWSKLMAPLEPPRCMIHNEPAKELVTKQGKNKGRAFWICSRPVGPGYDKGRGARLRSEVDHRWKCDFFKWSSDVKKEQTKVSSSSQSSQAK